MPFQRAAIGQATNDPCKAHDGVAYHKGDKSGKKGSFGILGKAGPVACLGAHGCKGAHDGGLRGGHAHLRAGNGLSDRGEAAGRLGNMVNWVVLVQFLIVFRLSGLFFI